MFKGEILEHDPMASERRQIEAAEQGGGGQRRREPRGLSRDERERTMLQPKRTKYRKQFKGRIHGTATAGTELNFGSFGLKALEPERVTARQIEAARRAITREMKRAGRVWIRVFPDVPVSKKPTEVRMGKGKGTPEFWAAASSPAASCSRSTACRWIWRARRCASAPPSCRSGRASCSASPTRREEDERHEGGGHSADEPTTS